MAYSGTWANNVPHGSGSITYTGGTYSGGIEFGQKHGIGIVKLADGRLIEGGWCRGLYHGFMKFNKPTSNFKS